MGSNGPRRPINYIQMLGDVLLANLAIILSFWVRFHGQIPKSNFQSYINIIPIVSILTLLIFNFYGLYNTKRKPWSDIFASITASTAILVPLTIAATYMVQGFSFPRSVFFLSGVAQLVILILWRRSLFNWEHKNAVSKSAVVVAPANEIEGLAGKVMLSGYNIIALVSSCPRQDADANVFPYDDIEILCNKYRPNAIFMSSQVPAEMKDLVAKVILESGISFFIIPSLYEIMLLGSRLDQIGDTPMLEMLSTPEAGKEQIKRFMDVILSTVGLVIAAPIMLLTAIAVKLDSQGPVFYRQERVSRGGKRFMVLKFRTMTNDAEKLTGPVLAETDDPRITKVGSILRATRIDELPQLFNVLKGDMSIVGPRPERPFFVEQFEQEIPEYSTRHTVKAGITGLAQVAGKYSTSPEDKLKYDLLYAKSASPLIDLGIMLQTIKVVLMRDKAS
ncbi:MAG: sugar transferase [Firmicutes bacterium]|nr:sugar transferase [Bacillota bacterium]